MSDNPFVKLVTPKVGADGRGTVVVLDRIEPGVQPAYCVHGKTTCYWCRDWCWLGDNSYELVASGEAAAICRPCAKRLLPKDAKPIRNAEDHLRMDGPH